VRDGEEEEEKEICGFSRIGDTIGRYWGNYMSLTTIHYRRCST